MAAVVAVVTDSTACLPADLVAGRGIRVVPLRVVLAGRAVGRGPPGADAQPDQDAAGAGETRPGPSRSPMWRKPCAAASGSARPARRRSGSPPPTRRPPPPGAAAIVSVHLSARLSGTVNSAILAARSAPVPVRVVDSQSIGMGLGLAVLVGRVSRAGGPGRRRGRRRGGRAARPRSARGSRWIPRAPCAPEAASARPRSLAAP